MKRPFYHSYAWAYDLLVDSKTETRVSFISEIAQAYHIPINAAVLDAGCGSGALAIALAERGFGVTGIDTSGELLSIAKSKRPDSNNPVFIKANLLDWDASSEYSMIVCRGVLNDLIKNTERRRVFDVFWNLLQPGGIVVADVRDWERTRVRKLEFPVQRKQVETSKGLLTFTSETTLNPNDNTLEISESHHLVGKDACFESPFQFKMRCWTLSEIVSNCHRVRFSIEKLLGDYNVNSRYGHSDRFVFVLRKGGGS